MPMMVVSLKVDPSIENYIFKQLDLQTVEGMIFPALSPSGECMMFLSLDTHQTQSLLHVLCDVELRSKTQEKWEEEGHPGHCKKVNLSYSVNCCLEQMMSTFLPGEQWCGVSFVMLSCNYEDTICVCVCVQPRMWSQLVGGCGQHWAAVPGRMSSVELCSEGPEVELVVERRLPWH